MFDKLQLCRGHWIRLAVLLAFLGSSLLRINCRRLLLWHIAAQWSKGGILKTIGRNELLVLSLVQATFVVVDSDSGTCKYCSLRHWPRPPNHDNRIKVFYRRVCGIAGEHTLRTTARLQKKKKAAISLLPCSTDVFCIGLLHIIKTALVRNSSRLS